MGESVERACSRWTSSARRPARSMSELSTSSSGRTPPTSRWSASVVVTPTSTRSRPACQVPPGARSRWNGWRCGASRPHRIPRAPPTPRSRATSSSSSRKRRRTGSRSARSKTSEAVTRPSASSSSRATTPSTGLVWRNARSARRTRRSGRRCPSTASRPPRHLAAERRVDQRRVRLDVRAHDDDVARLERRVVGKDVQERVAQHLDLAGAAVAGVDLEAAVERRVVVGVRGAVVADVGLQASEERVGSVCSLVVLMESVCVGGREDDLQLARVLAPGGEKAVVRRVVGVVVAARPAGAAVRDGRSQRAGDGCRRCRWTSRCAAIALSTCSRAAGRRVRPNIARRPGGRRAPARPGGARRRRRGARRGRDLRCAAADATAPPARGSSPSPAAHPLSISGRCSA